MDISYNYLYYSLQTSHYTGTNSASPIHFSELDCSTFIVNLEPKNEDPCFTPVENL